MSSKKHKSVIITLITVFAVFALALIVSWCMFSPQLRAVGTIKKMKYQNNTTPHKISRTVMPHRL